MIKPARAWSIFVSKWTWALLLIPQPPVLGRESTHKVSGISQIPWNMLLDPNYLSHKMPVKSNRTSFTPSTSDEYSYPSSTSHYHQQNSFNHQQNSFNHQQDSFNHQQNSFNHQQNSFNHQQDSFTPMKESTNVGMYYVPPPTNQVHSNQNVKYSPPYYTKEPKPSYSFSVPLASYNPAQNQKVTFPTSSTPQGNKYESSNYGIASQKKNKKGQQKVPEKKKEKKRKPDEYEDLDDEEYSDSYFEDYDYFEVQRPKNRPLRHSSQKYKEVGDPMGLLPSASDPEGFFSKAKDLLRGASRGKPGYSPSATEFYPSYPPNKQYEDSTTYGEQPYYGQESNGYPSKDGHYGNDYDIPYGEAQYGDSISYKKKGSKYGPLAFALGLLPLGLLLASLVPTVVTIPVTTAVAQGRRRKRSVQFVNPVLETISDYGVAALEDPSCLSRIFCQVVRDGQRERSSIVQKLYFKIASVLDEKIAASVGLQQLLIAVRKDQCNIFPCPAQNVSKKMSSP